MLLTIILPVVLHGCETWSLTQREEHRLRRIFRAKRDEVTGQWRRVHNEELHYLCSSPNIIRVIKSRTWTRHVARTGDRGGAHTVLVGKPEGRKPLGRTMPRWEDNIRTNLQ